MLVVDRKALACNDFRGFGAEWDSKDYLSNALGQEDWNAIFRRLQWMRMPLVRIMMLGKWCYQGEKRFDFATPEMKNLYRQLDHCKAEGTEVILTDWGCLPDWLRIPEVSAFTDPLYAAIIGTYLEELIVKRGYSCIKALIIGNEPNYEVKDFPAWKVAVNNVKAELERRNLTNKIALWGPDVSGEYSWLDRTAAEIPNNLAAWDLHAYAKDEMVKAGQFEGWLREQWDKIRKIDPKKRCYLTEAGMETGAEHPKGNRNIDTFDYGLQMADYAIQAVNAGSDGVLAWMLDDNSHAGFYWGLWRNKAEGMKVRPWFYVWSLLCRFVPRGAKMYRIATGENIRLLAASWMAGREERWSFGVVNRSTKAASVRVGELDGHAGLWSWYEYGRKSAKATREGFPLCVGERTVDLSKGVEIIVPGESFSLATMGR